MYLLLTGVISAIVSGISILIFIATDCGSVPPCRNFLVFSIWSVIICLIAGGVFLVKHSKAERYNKIFYFLSSLFFLFPLLTIIIFWIIRDSDTLLWKYIINALIIDIILSVIATFLFDKTFKQKNLQKINNTKAVDSGNNVENK